MIRIDAHQHFWALERGDYGWLTPELEVIYRDFLPHDLAPHLDRHNLSGTVLVQAAPTVEETRFMLSLADSNELVKGVVGWVDFENPAAPDLIADLAGHRSLVGLRPMIQDIPDADWMLRNDLQPAFDALQKADLTFDALTLPHHLSNLQELLARHPEMRVVIDHGSKPVIREGHIKDWAADMAALADKTQACCKLSGLVTEAKPDWTVDDLRPYVEHLLETFGPDRLIWGSDWPVCLLASDYARWVETTGELLSDLSSEEQNAILGGNAIRAYKLTL
ncbi:amidohydrolase family protein [Roseibium sp. SCP14]|uniref:amidohydrolase family protein n=1 Tax=Roseibium sp. SCP14 TaxID=3141375 RepID=UPI0033387438